MFDGNEISFNNTDDVKPHTLTAAAAVAASFGAPRCNVQE
jgi:hypothetical protein